MTPLDRALKELRTLWILKAPSKKDVMNADNWAEWSDEEKNWVSWKLVKNNEESYNVQTWKK